MNFELLSRGSMAVLRQRRPAPAFGGEPPGWMLSAACAAVGVELFYPETHGEHAGEAKYLCAGCPVRGECLAFALANESGGHDGRHGVFGGMSPNERARIARTGWQLGDPLPPVVGAGYSRRCPACGERVKDIDTHTTRKHGVAA